MAVAVALPFATPARGDWHGRGRASGVVTGVDGQPLAGARVTLRLADDGGGPPRATTGRRGEWSLLGLAPGSWRITVEADGYVAAEGTVAVAEDSPAPPLRTALRPLDEGTPAAAEHPGTVTAWLQKGDSLLSQGRPAEARVEYEKAAEALPPEERPAVLQAIARCHFLEGQGGLSLATLEQAVRLAPGDEPLRRLLRAVADELGRTAEAETFLAELGEPPAGEAETAPEAGLPPEIAALLAAPAETPLAGRPGSYKVAFAERSPWSAAEELLGRAGLERRTVLATAPGALAYRLDAETFQVRVPSGEPPASGWGLVVWISPGLFGGPGRPEMDMRASLDRHRLVWVGANHAGNERPRWDRWGLALDAAWNVRRLYPIDPERVYVAGYSGGGRAASVVNMLYPDVFRGGLMVMGVDWYRDLAVPDRPGARWPAPYGRPPRGLLRLARERSRWVLLTGERDFNRLNTRTVQAELVEDGFHGVTLLEVPGMTHYGPLPEDWLERAFAALDPRTTAQAGR